MFTGLVETIGEVHAVLAEPPGKRLVICAPFIAQTARVGESIAVNGCCLTVVRQDGDLLDFEAGPETLSRTNLGQLLAGTAVNVERSLMLSDRLGGHLVTGHIDGVGTVVGRHNTGDWTTMWISVPRELITHLACKGSVAVDGVSLTVVSVDGEQFSVQLIPHTLANTTLGGREAGDRVNIETDLLAKYVERQFSVEGPRSKVQGHNVHDS